MLHNSKVMSLLVNLEAPGINIDNYMRQLVVSKDIPVEVLKFIVQNQGIEVEKFYEMLRVKHNKNKSPLYTNLLKDDMDSMEIIITLTSLLQQIALYSKKLDSEIYDKFISEVRAEEITRSLNNYFSTGEIETCKTVLQLVKNDLLVLEYLNERRDLN